MKNQFDKMREAIEQVERNNKDYYNDCLLFAYGWIKNQFKAFTSEQLKEAYYAAGNEPPNEPRVFGAIFSTLAKEGLVFKLKEWVYSKNPTCHGRPMRQWISKEFKEKQSNNAKGDKTQLGITFNN